MKSGGEKKRKRPIFNILICAVILLAVATAGISVIFPSKYEKHIKSVSAATGVDEKLLKAVIWVESKFDRKAVSSAGAVGLMQLMPSTAYYVAELNDKKIDYEDLFDAKTSIELGGLYLSMLIKKFGDEKTALCAYNAGEGNVENWLKSDKGIPFKETRDYLKRVAAAKKIYSIKFW